MKNMIESIKTLASIDVYQKLVDLVVDMCQEGEDIQFTYKELKQNNYYRIWSHTYLCNKDKFTLLVTIEDNKVKSAKRIPTDSIVNALK